MVRASDFRFNGYQAAAFYGDARIQTRRLLPVLLQALDILDGEPVSLPVPADAPAEIPRMFLATKDESIRIEVALARMDLRWRRMHLGDGLDLDTFVRLAQTAMSCVQQALDLRPGRLALVLHRFVANDDPGRTLAAHFCKPELLSNAPHKGPLNRPEEFELHAYKKFDLGPFHVNSWMRAKSGLLKGADDSSKIVLVEQDLNTILEPESERTFGESEIRDFYHGSVVETDAILRLYFPDDPDSEGRR